MRSEAVTAPTRSGVVFLDLLIIFSIPAIQALINDDWLYSQPGWLDPWYYFGYGLNYNDPTYLNEYYKVSRLPWIFAEYMARSLFDPITASWLLQLATLSLASASLYGLFLLTVGPRSAFIAVVFFASYPFAHASGGADYQNTLAGPAYALTWFWAIRTAHFGPTKFRLLLLGIFTALTIHSSVVFCNLMPILIAHYGIVHRERQGAWPSPLRTLIWAGVGGLAITAIMGAINKWVGRDFFFFMRQFDLAKSFVMDNSLQKSWWRPWSSGWYWDASYLGPILAIFVASLVTMFVAQRNRAILAPSVLLIGGFLLACVSWLIWQTLGQTALDWSYFAYPLIYPCIGAVAGLLGYWTPANRNMGTITKVALAAFAILILASYTSLPLGLRHAGVTYGLIFGLILVGTLKFAPLRAQSIILFMVLLIATALSMGSLASSYAPSACSLPREVERAMDSAHRYIRDEKRKLNIRFDQVLMWSNRSEYVDFAQCKSRPTLVLSDFQPSLVSTGFAYLEPPWGVQTTDQIADKRLKEVISTGGMVVYITNRPEDVDALKKRFVALGAKLGEERFYNAGTDRLAIPIRIFSVKENVGS